MTVAFIGLGHMGAVERSCRQARARYGDTGDEMLPVKPLEDLTGTPISLAAPRE